MKKQFFVAAMALVLGAGFTACSSDDLNAKPGTEVNQKATTYMSVSFVLPTANSTRAAADGQDDADPKFNNVGKWAGKDKIEKVNVYVFDATGALEANPTYTTAQLSFTQVSTGADKAKVSANSAFKVKPGNKTVYVVVNPTTAAENLLNIAANNTLAAFETAYKSENLAFAKNSYRTTEYTTGDETNAGELAKVDNDKDIILMTGPAATPTIDDNVSAAEAVSGAKNRADLTVQRAVARVFVTTSATSFTLKGMNPTSMTEEAGAITVSDLTYVVGQGENKFYFLQKDNGGNDGAAFTTPAFAQVPSSTDDYFTAAYQTVYTNIGKHYDYSGLWKNTAGSTKVKGVTVPTRAAAFSGTAATELGNVTTDLNTALKGEFILPTLHKYNTDRAQSGYRKGNTSYILIRGYLTPKYVVKADGSVVDGSTLGANDDLYLGANGVFYADKATVRDAAKKGVAGQTAQKYVGRKVLYFVWINPDEVDGKPVNSPVIRNNIYHVSIKGISKVGANWNPLVPVVNPNDPNITDPNNPNNPVNNNPNNPDPRPDNDIEPKDPPVDPTDPISTKETWMSVNVNILPWAVHSYEVELSI